MPGLLLKYNKVHNESLHYLAEEFSQEIVWGELSDNLLSYSQVKHYISQFPNLNFILTGDVFWDTGQAICKYGKEHKIPVFFLQHGQWIYIKNKQKLNHYPTHTLLFGDNVAQMCSTWTYGKYSKLHVTGNPRYDNASLHSGDYVYFSPPVIEEMIHNEPSGHIRQPFLNNLEALKGIDNDVRLCIQPHYREIHVNHLRTLFPKATFADPQDNSLKWVHGASTILTSRNSTVVLDAIAYYKPVVLMDFPDNDACLFKRGYFQNFAVESENKSDVLNNLHKIEVNWENYVSRAKKHIFLGHASSRIAGIMQHEL